MKEKYKEMSKLSLDELKKVTEEFKDQCLLSKFIDIMYNNDQ